MAAACAPITPKITRNTYPAATSSRSTSTRSRTPTPRSSGNLWYVAQGVERLVKWGAGQKVVWNCIECTRIQSKSKATPSQVRSEVWMSLIHGSMGLIYFVHEWQPKFDEAALLHDPEMLREVTAINRQITELAPVLNSPTVRDTVQVSSSDPQVPVAVMLKQHEGATYLFAVAMRNGATTATLRSKASLEIRRPKCWGKNAA